MLGAASTAYEDSVILRLRTGRDVRAVVRRCAEGDSGCRLVLLHGNPGSLQDWAPLLDRLERSSELVAFDLPGFGQSARPGRDASNLTLGHLADDAIAVADALGWRESFYLLGHSHGGGVAQMAASRHPERIAGIVLIGTLGVRAHRTYRLLALPGATAAARLTGRLFQSEHLLALNRRLVESVLSDIFYPNSASAARVDRELATIAGRPEILVSMVQVAQGRPCDSLLRAASGIRCPALFLHGEYDALVPIHCSRATHECIVRAGGRSEFRVIRDAGHMLVEFQAAEVAEAIGQFLFHVRQKKSGSCA